MTDNTNPGTGGDKPAPTQAELDAASAARYQAQQGGTSGDTPIDEIVAEGDKPTRPEHIPEKFWDAEKGEVRVDELAKSYAELEKAKATPPAKEGEGEGDPTGDDARLTEFATLRTQATEKLAAGEDLTPEMYETFEKKHGLSKDDVDAFIEGQKARGQLIVHQVHSEVGGEANYTAMLEWGKSTYTPEEQAQYTRDIHSGDPAVRLGAVRGLAARYEQANGRSGLDVTRGGSSTAGNGYASGAEMRADMKTEKYKKDPAFRAEVARKAAASRAAGVDLAL